MPVGQKSPDRASIGGVALGEIGCATLVFVNGRHAPGLSTWKPGSNGIWAGSLAAALESYPGRIGPHLGRHADFQSNPFTALNTAFLEDAGVVLVSPGAVLEEPIHLLFLSLSGNEPAVSHPRTLILAGAGSEASVIETYTGPPEGVYLTNAATEIVLEDGARLEHSRVQAEGPAAFHVAAIQADQARASRLVSHAISIGAALARVDVGSRLSGEGATCLLNGLYTADGARHVDHHTTLDHAAPGCSSLEIYKGILGGNARAVFNGRIVVRPLAQKTDARQSNRNLLLSDDAVVHTRPQLEIYANDVKCTHGATVGQLDAEGMFYLRSRGIGPDQARLMLIHAFAGEVLDRIRFAPLRRRIRDEILPRLPALPGLEVRA